MINFVDKTTNFAGTPFNRINMMGLQGFVATTVSFANGVITETSANGDVYKTEFTTVNGVNKVIETFTATTNGSSYTIVKTTTFNSDGTITTTLG